MHLEILDPSRKKLLPSLGFLKGRGFYLAGGTALALQLGHRRSVDFDFYTEKEFNEMALERDLMMALPQFIITQRAKGTLLGQMGEIELSFFHYPYILLESPLQESGLALASVSDIAAMKLIALSQRGLRRDFLDLFVIAQETGLEKTFTWAKNKFPQFDPHVCLKALTYFEDAEKDDSGRGMELMKPVPWSKVESFFLQEARRLVKLWL